MEFAKPIVGSRGQVDVVYFDCSKAFDLVDHNLLLSKLSHMGLSSGFCDWFASYLGERSNMVSYLGCKSFPYLLKSGVPQGSNLGPLLFNIFVNDLVTSVSDSMMLQYADDVKICRSIHTPVDCELLQKDIDAIHLWCCANSLVLNPTKTKVVSFSRKANVVHPYTLDGSEISRSSVVRDLGILIDSRLNFNYHVSKVINDSLRILGIISRITRDFQNYTCILNLFRALVLSRLDFCSTVWNSLGVTQALRLECIQRRLVRIVYDRHIGRSVFYDYVGLLDTLGLSPLSTRRLVRDMVFLYKLFNSVFDSPMLLSRISIHVPQRQNRSTPFFYPSYLESSPPLTRMMLMYNKFFNPHVDFFIPFKKFKNSIVVRIDV